MQMTIPGGKLYAVLFSWVMLLGCSGETDSEQTATKVESLLREVQIKRNSLSAVEEKLKDPKLSNLKDSLERSRIKFQSEIESLEQQIEEFERDSSLPPDRN